MAEYGSGMFYGGTNSRFPNVSPFTSSSLSQILYLPPQLEIGPPFIQPKLKLDRNIPEDIILFAEFSEIEGPVPLVSIPEHITGDIDLNDFVLQLMSTNYQNVGGPFQVSRDTFLLHEDPFAGHYFCVQYFTLYDVRARGFVRPVCLAYLSREPQKLRKYFKAIQKEFEQAAEYMRTSNLKIFAKEIKMRIKDLHFTKKRFLHSYDHLPRDDSKNIQGNCDQYSDKKYLNPKRIIPFYNGEDLSSATTCNDKTTGTVSSPYLHSPNGRDLTGLHYQVSFQTGTASSGSPMLEMPLHSSSPVEMSQLAFQIRSEFHPDALKSLSPVSKSKYEPLTFKGSPKESVLESSLSSNSSSSTVKSSSREMTTIKVSALMLDESLDQKLSASEEVSILQHTSLEALALQLIDCQNILETVEKYMESSTIKYKLTAFLNEVKQRPLSPLCIALQELNLFGLSDEEKEGSVESPAVFVISLMRRNFRNMRIVKQICGIGYALAMLTLMHIYEQYSKSALTLHFEELDKEIYEDPFSSLFIGNIPVIKIGNNVSVAGGNKGKDYCIASACWDKEFVRLLSRDMSKSSSPASEYADAVDQFDLEDVTVGDDCLEVFIPVKESAGKIRDPSTREDDRKSIDSDNIIQTSSADFQIPDCRQRTYTRSTSVISTSSDGSWSSSITRELSMLDQIEREFDDEGEEEPVFSSDNIFKNNRMLYLDIDQRLEFSKLYHLSAVVQQFSGVSQCIMHSILSGKPVIIAGSEYLKSVVILYTKALSTLLPCKPNQIHPVLKWHKGIITNHHTSLYKIIGVCIPERIHVQDLMSISTLNQVTILNIETGHISGVAYSGSLLQKADQLSRRHCKSDLTLQTSLQSILVTLGMKAFLLYHLMKTTSRTVNEILKGIGIPRGDWSMVYYLANMVQQQIEDCSTVKPGRVDSPYKM